MTMEIPKAKVLADKVFAINNEQDFDKIALEMFKFQYFNNPFYREYCDTIKRNPSNVNDITGIPFLPISFFKNRDIKTTDFEPEVVFKSSGTTGVATSRHLVKDAKVYKRSFLSCFEQFYGAVNQLCIVGLLPSYLEQGNSSLIFMVSELIRQSGHELNDFYLYDHKHLYQNLLRLEEQKQQTVLFGVSYALLDFAEKFSLNLQNTIIIETGGMKGRREEMTREEFYSQLRNAFGVQNIHSEYGMTELLSQAYGLNGRLKTPAWMKVLLRDETDPFSYNSKSGAVNVIDLANLYSCCFIATEDLGKFHPDSSFEVLGRMDNTDIRGCSQLVL